MGYNSQIMNFFSGLFRERSEDESAWTCAVSAPSII